MEQNGFDEEEQVLQSSRNDQESIFLEDPDTQQVEMNQKGKFRQQEQDKQSEEMILEKSVNTKRRGRKRKINTENNNNEHDQKNNHKSNEKEKQQEKEQEEVGKGRSENEQDIKKEIGSAKDDNYDDLIDYEEFAKKQNKGISRYGNKKGRRRANEKDHNLPLDNKNLMNTLQGILKEYGFLEGNVELDLTVQDNELKIQEKEEEDIDQLEKTVMYTNKEEEGIEKQQQSTLVQNSQSVRSTQLNDNSRLQNTVKNNNSNNDSMQERRFSRSYTLSEDLRIICEMSQKTNLINGYSSNYWRDVVNRGKILRPHESLRDRYKRFLKYITADDLGTIIRWITKHNSILGFLNFTKFKNNFKIFSHISTQDPFSSKKQSFSGRPLKKQRNGSDTDSNEDSEEESKDDMKEEKIEQNSEQMYKIENKMNMSLENNRNAVQNKKKKIKKEIIEDSSQNDKEIEVKREEHSRKQKIMVNGMTEAIEIDSSDMSDEEINKDPLFQKYRKQSQKKYQKDKKQQKRISQIMQLLKLPKMIIHIENNNSHNDSQSQQNVKDEWQDIITIHKKEEDEEQQEKQEDLINENNNKSIMLEQYFLQEQQVKVEDNNDFEVSQKDDIIKFEEDHDDCTPRQEQQIDGQIQHESKVDEQQDVIVQSRDESYQYQSTLEIPFKSEEQSLEFEVKAEEIDSLIQQEVVQQQEQDIKLESQEIQDQCQQNNIQDDDSELYVQETRWIKCTNRLGSTKFQDAGHPIENRLHFE